MLKKIPDSVIAAIESERYYQSRKWGERKHTVAEWILIMEKLTNDLRQAWVTKNGDNAALNEIRQVVATGVACLEEHGAPMRKHRPNKEINDPFRQDTTVKTL